MASFSRSDRNDGYEVKMEKRHRSKASHFGVAVAQTAKSMLRNFVRTKVSVRTVD
jgi:hypothetical protein